MPDRIEQATAAPGETRDVSIPVPDAVEDHQCEIASSTPVGTLQTCPCGAQWTRVR